MERLPITRASQLIQIARALEARGCSARRVLARGGWPDWYLEQPDVLIPTRHIWQFMKMAAHAAGDPVLGHQVAAHAPVAALGTRFAARLLGSATVFDELRRFCAHLNLQTSNMYAWLEDGGPDHVWLCVKAMVDDIGLAEMEQTNLMQLTQLLRLGVGPTWKPSKVWIQVGLAPEVAATPLLADAEIHQRQRCTAIAVPRRVLAMPLHYQRRRPARPATVNPAPPPAGDVLGSLRHMVRSWLPHEPVRIETAAEAAGLELRTLQRRLAGEGTTFRELIDRTRFEAATELLEDDDVSIADIAFEVGYTDPAHFTRAFRRWAGVTPRAYRCYRPRLAEAASASTGHLA